MIMRLKALENESNKLEGEYSVDIEFTMHLEIIFFTLQGKQ